MHDIIAQIIAEFRALGASCAIHGPEVWLFIVALCAGAAFIVLGMWIAALLTANKEDDDDDR